MERGFEVRAGMMGSWLGGWESGSVIADGVSGWESGCVIVVGVGIGAGVVAGAVVFLLQHHCGEGGCMPGRTWEDEGVEKGSYRDFGEIGGY
jgi:hypothetical protein